MKKILIENYRGFDIEFDVNSEKFQCVCTEENTKESTSFASVKKFIDEYRKTNQDFTPFWVQPNPLSPFSKDKNLKVIGIRKDGKYVAEDDKGNKEQIVNHNLSGYILLNHENDIYFNKLKEHDAKVEEEQNKNREIRNAIISQINIVTLKDYKKSLA